MSLWIKICGNTTLEDAQLAAEAGADALGFVFAPSPRQVTLAQAAAIVPHLPAAVEKIGVFVDASFEEVSATVEAVGLTGAQLHFDAPPELSAQLRHRFGLSLRIVRVVRFTGGSPDMTALKDPNINGILVDSHTATAVGGTGIPFNWDAARDSLFAGSRELQLIAAGGLSPENVAEAIAKLKPWGVDVVSGVEISPGRKDVAKVRAFIANARGAARSWPQTS